MAIKILSVDDSRTIRLIVARAFRFYDCEVCEASNGEDGLVVAAREKPDLIILDVTMPVMDGVTMLGKLKQDPLLRAIPVIMLTAESGRDNVLHIARLGARDYLVKPFREEQLVEKAGRLVTLPRKAALSARVPLAPEAPDSTCDELAQRWLEPVPESVVRLTQLVARQDADLDEIAQVIAQDRGMTERLLRAANPRARRKREVEITTVEQALLRTGMSCALLLAMGAPLTSALVRTFKTMLDLKLESADPNGIEPLLTEHVLGTIGFSGRAQGRVYVRLSVESARRIAARILGLSLQEVKTRGEIDDAVGELVNIVTGNFKSNLCDAGLDCRLHTPAVSRTRDFHLEVPAGAGFERMAFCAPELVLFVDVTVNPWSRA